MIQQTLEWLCIQSQAAAAVVTMDTDKDKSLRDRLMRRRIHNKVERGGQTALTAKKKSSMVVEAKFKTPLNSFSMDSTSIQYVSKLFEGELLLKPFA